MDRLIAVSRAIVDKIEHEGRSGTKVSLIYNGVDLERYDHPEPCCTLREEYGMEPGCQIVGVVARLETEKGHPTLDAWPLVLRSVPSAYLLVVGEGSRRESLEQQAAELRIAHRVVFTGRATTSRPSPPPWTWRCSRPTARPGIDGPRGDGAVAPGGRVQRRGDSEMIEDG